MIARRSSKTGTDMTDVYDDSRASNSGVSQPSTRILNSWKEIATYLGRGVRTIQRYEEKLGLPIHRPAASPRSAVFALADELEDWLRNSPSRNGTHSNSANGFSTVLNIEEIQFEDDLRSELARVKQEMDRARAEYGRTLKKYNALNRRVRAAETSSADGKLKRRIAHEQQFAIIS